MKVVTVEQMRELEQGSVKAGVSLDQLMENAGLAVAQKALEILGQVQGKAILVLVGSGNNGGDGLVVARHLHDWGARVFLYLCAARKADDPKYRLVATRGLPVVEAAGDRDHQALRERLSQSHMVIDAILGTGRSHPLESPLREILEMMQAVKASRSDLTLLALDLPTGLDADSGATDPACPAMDYTITLGYPKLGLYSHQNGGKAGRVLTVDIGIPPHLAQEIPTELITQAHIRSLLPARPLEAHKGTFGRILAVAGSRHYIGAAYLACAAAYRVGAGLVTLATPRSLVPVIASRLPEVTYLPLPEDESGTVGPSSIAMVKDSLKSYEVLMIGCGLGQSAGVASFLEELLLGNSSLPPTVLDADALNNLASVPRWWETFPQEAVLTPHAGEMARLSQKPVSVVQGSRIETVLQAAHSWNKSLVLKGAFSIIASPQQQVRISPFANPLLASAGSGDVLTGVIAGFMAQGLAFYDAATAGVYLHAQAGERVRERIGDAGLLASDLLAELPLAIKGLKEER